MGCQNMVGYPEFPELPTVNLRSIRRKYAKFSHPLSKIFKKLQQKNLLQPREPKPLPNPLPPQIDQDLFCHFHQMPGHTTDDFKTLKNAIQDLIDSRKIDDPERRPNVKTNPLPNYQAMPPPAINIISFGIPETLIKKLINLSLKPQRNKRLE